MMASREVNRLRLDIHNWHRDVQTIAPSLAKYVVGSEFDDPGLLDTFSDLAEHEHELIPILESLLKRDCTRQELDEWIRLISSCDKAAKAKRLRTSRALDDPAWRRLDKPGDNADKLLQSCREELERSGIPAGVLGKWVVPSKKRQEITEGVKAEKKNELLQEVLELVMEGSFPLSSQLRLSSVPLSIAVRLAGGRRLTTIQKHLRRLRHLVRWNHAVFGRKLPSNWIEIAQYLEDIAKEPCGPSVPASVLKALDFLEMMGGTKEDRRMCRDPSLMQVSLDIAAELKRGRPAGVKKSPPQPVAALVSSELAVVDCSKPVYTRLHNWVKLVRHWAALRWDDTLHTPPKLARYTVEGLTLKITQTKTTGPGKKVELLYAYISAKAYLCVPDWLDQGWRLLGELGFDEREYLLPLPTADLESFSKSRPKYQDALAMARQEMRELVAVGASEVDGRIVFDYLVDADGHPEPLFEEQVQLFWKLHGDRATVINWALVLGFDKEARQFLGRWCPSSSDEYIRTQKHVTMKIQKTLSEQIRSRSLEDCGFLGEVDTWEEFKNWALEKNLPSNIVDRQLRKLRAAFLGATEKIALGPYGTLGEHPGESDDDGFTVVRAEGLALAGGDVEQIGLPALNPVQLPPLDTDTENEDSNPAGLEVGTFVVSHRACGKARTLHRIGRCWRMPGVHYSKFTVLKDLDSIEDVSLGQFERICKDCYPTKESMQASTRQVNPFEDTDLSSSEDDSSSEQSD